MMSITDIIGIINSYNAYIIVILVLFNALLFVLCLLLLAKTKKKKRKIDMSNSDPDAIIDELENLDNKIESVHSYAKNISKHTDNIDKEINKCLKNIGVERFDAFEDCGGKQSFSAAILDDEKNGFIIRNIWTRESTRTYIKEINSGEGEKDLPIEDINAIKKALE